MRRIGIFGGTFDPPHKGHIAIAEKAVKQLELNKVYFIPAYIPPHKRLISSSVSQHRFNMLQLAIEGRKNLSLSDIELKRRGISYTIETLREFKRRFPNDDLVLIIGADNFALFNLWKSPKAILKLASLAVYKRKGFNRALKNHKIKFELIKGRLLQVSSTEIRKRIDRGLPVSTLIPRSITMYIKRNSLYRQSCSIIRKSKS